MIIDVSNNRIVGYLKTGLLVAVISIGISRLIFFVLRLIGDVDVSTTNVLLLALLLLLPVMVSINTEFLEKILLTQKKPSRMYWDYRVYKIDENPANVSPKIRISNDSDMSELAKLGFESLYGADGNNNILDLEKGMSMLNRIGWELIQVQKIGEFKYYYIFRRSSEESLEI